MMQRGEIAWKTSGARTSGSGERRMKHTLSAERVSSNHVTDYGS